MSLGCSSVAPRMGLQELALVKRPLPSPQTIPTRTVILSQSHRCQPHTGRVTGTPTTPENSDLSSVSLSHTHIHTHTQRDMWSRAWSHGSHHSQSHNDWGSRTPLHVTHHTPFPGASPTPHLPWPPPRPLPSFPRRLFPPVRGRAGEVAGTAWGPAARRSEPDGAAGSGGARLASEGRGARPSEPGPPRSLLPKRPCIRRDSPASGFEGGGATSEEGAGLRGRELPWSPWWRGGQNPSVPASSRSGRSRSLPGLWRRALGPEEVWVAPELGLGHLSNVGAKGEVVGMKGGVVEPLWDLPVPSVQVLWRKQVPSPPCKTVWGPLWVPGLGAQSFASSLFLASFSPWEQPQTSSVVLHCNAPTPLSRLVLRVWGLSGSFLGTAPTEPPAPASLTLKE